MIARLVIVRTQLFLRHLHQALLVVETRIGVPHGEEGVDMGFRVGFVVIARIWVQHGVVLGIGRELPWWAIRRRLIELVLELEVTSAGCCGV